MFNCLKMNYIYYRIFVQMSSVRNSYYNDTGWTQKPTNSKKHNYIPCNNWSLCSHQKSHLLECHSPSESANGVGIVNYSGNGSSFFRSFARTFVRSFVRSFIHLVVQSASQQSVSEPTVKPSGINQLKSRVCFWCLEFRWWCGENNNVVIQNSIADSYGFSWRQSFHLRCYSTLLLWLWHISAWFNENFTK